MRTTNINTPPDPDSVSSLDQAVSTRSDRVQLVNERTGVLFGESVRRSDSEPGEVGHEVDGPATGDRLQCPQLELCRWQWCYVLAAAVRWSSVTIRLLAQLSMYRFASQLKQLLDVSFELSGILNGGWFVFDSHTDPGSPTAIVGFADLLGPADM